MLMWLLTVILVVSPVCETTGYAIKTDHLVGTTPTPTATLKDPTQEGLYDVLCGTSLKQAIEVLEKDGRALMNLGGFTGLLYSVLFASSHTTQPPAHFRSGHYWRDSDGNARQRAHDTSPCIHDSWHQPYQRPI